MNKMNLAELLKDCASGVELYSPLFGDCKFVKVHDYEAEIIVEIETGANVSFKTDGRYYDYPNAECLLFPIGKTTWEGFVPPCEFKDGDILATDLGSVFFLNTRLNTDECYGCYVGIGGDGSFHICEPFAYKECCGLATEEEKEKLFKAIKDNGYQWNAETKTLEKVPKIKDGDIIYIKTSLSKWVSIFEKFDDDECKCYVNYCIDSDTYYGKIGGKKNPLCYIDEIVEQRLATEEEKQKLFDVIKEHGHQWNTKTKTLEKLIKPKFKVGDMIVKKDNPTECWYVQGVNTNCNLDYFYYIVTKSKIANLHFKDQDDYESAPNKFDINTLKPFDKVLVRGNVGQRWTIDFFGFMDNNKGYPFVCVGHYVTQCIPYESNEHLLGTTNDCDEYYKNW